MGTQAALHRPIPKWLAIGMGSVSLLLLVLTLFLLFAVRGIAAPENADTWNASIVADVVSAMGVGVLGILIGLKQPSNRVGWLFLAAGVGLSIGHFCGALGSYILVGGHGPVALGDAVASIGSMAWPVPITALILLILLFPTGEVPSPRWRWLGILTLCFGTVTLLFAFVTQIAIWHAPYTNITSASQLTGLAHVFALFFPEITIGLPVLLIGALAGVVVRYRRSRGDERLQMKWFLFAAVFVVVFFTLDSGSSALLGLLTGLALLGLWAAIGIAMLKYRLYDIDVVVRKTLVGGVLVVFVTAVYAAVVAGLGALGSSVGVLNRGPLIAIATAIIAIAFQPVLRRARRLANRLVYGERATPYEVLSEFSERMGETYSVDEVPVRMARILGEGTGATEATVWLHVGRQLRAAAIWPTGSVLPASLASPGEETVPVVPGADRTFPVRHQGELLGALSVSMPPDEPMSSEHERLCTDLAAQAGLVLRNVRLIEELRSSRERLVVAQDQERRKLERNLHDGAQQQLVALSVKERLASRLIDREPAKARDLLEQIQAETTEALETLRDLARGIYPPLLADQGLLAALEAQARKAPLPVEVDGDGIGRYPQEVEAAVYFASLEALQNVSKYAEASRAWVDLGVQDGELVFSVRDDGKGFDPETTSLGTGLQGIDDRLSALGGRMLIDARPGAGSRLEGRLPIRD